MTSQTTIILKKEALHLKRQTNMCLFVNLQLAGTVQFVAWHVNWNRPGGRLSVLQST